MALVKNVSLRPLPLTTGSVLARGSTANVDTSQPAEAGYLSSGQLIIVDGTVAPTPADPLLEQAGRTFTGATQPISMVPGDLWFKPVGASFEVRRLTSSGLVLLGTAGGTTSDAGAWTASAAVTAGSTATLPDGTKGTRLPGTPATTRPQWDATESSSWKATSPRLAPFEYTPMTTFGHSWANGGPDIATGARLADRLAARCKATPAANYGVGGRRMDQILLEQVIPTWVPNSLGWALFVDGTINDSTVGDASWIPTTQEAFRTALSVISSRARFTNADPAMQFGGGASAASVPNNGYVDIAFTGDAVDIEVQAATDAGGTFTVYQAGNALGTIQTGGYKAAFPLTKRFSGFGAGAHTVRVKATTASGQVLAAALPSAAPPPIVWVHSADRNISTPSNAIAKQYADAAQTIAATFSNVIVVVPDAFWDQTRYVGPGFHPNDLGMAYLANLCERQMAATVHRQGLNQLSAATQDITYAAATPAYSQPGATAPSAPILAGATGTQVQLTITPPQDGGSTITGYKVQSSPTGAGTWTDVATITPSQTSYRVANGLTQGSAYDFRVAAINAVGQGAYSTVLSNITAGATFSALFTANFTDAAATDLTALTSNAWTKNTQFPGTLVLDASKRVTCTTSAAGCYYAPYTPGVADYSVRGTFDFLTAVASHQVALAARMVTNADTMYLARYVEGSGWKLSKKVAGTLTDLSSADTTHPLDATHLSRDVVLTCQGSTISMSVDGAVIASVTDSAIAAAGRGGIFVNGQVGQSTGVHIRGTGTGAFSITT